MIDYIGNRYGVNEEKKMDTQFSNSIIGVPRFTRGTQFSNQIKDLGKIGGIRRAESIERREMLEVSSKVREIELVISDCLVGSGIFLSILSFSFHS